MLIFNILCDFFKKLQSLKENCKFYWTIARVSNLCVAMNFCYVHV